MATFKRYKDRKMMSEIRTQAIGKFLDSGRPGDEMVAMMMIHDEAKALGLPQDHYSYYCEQLKDDLLDIHALKISRRALRFILRRLEDKRLYEWRQKK